jgi:hypothetical protein
VLALTLFLACFEERKLQQASVLLFLEQSIKKYNIL